jgi:hypothetical protein
MTEFRFLSSFSPALGLLLMLLAAGLAWWLYYREVYDFQRPYRWLLPTLRAAAIALVVMMLLEPSLRYRFFEGTPTRLQVWVDATESMSELDSPVQSTTESQDRYARAINTLLDGDSPQLEQWTKKGEVVLGRFGGDTSAVLWQSTLQQPNGIPTAESVQATEWIRPTSLSYLLSREKERLGIKSSEEDSAAASGTKRAVEQSSPLLLFTDGQHNSGSEPLEVLKDWPKERAPIYIVGMGESTPPEKVSILGVETPQQLYRSDRLQGTVRIQCGLPKDTNYDVAIMHDGEVLWSENRTSTGPGNSEVAFSFAIEDLVKKLEKNLPEGQQVQKLTVPLEAKVTTVPANQSAPSSSYSWLLGVTTRKQRILLLDSRSRWETRYLRNALERDPQWEVHAYLVEKGKSPQWFSQGLEEVPFPDEPHQYDLFDLIVCGELEPEAITEEVAQNIQHTIQRGGAGCIVIDGQRGYWKNDAYRTLRPLLPIEWQEPIDQDGDSTWLVKPVMDSTYSSILSLSEGNEQNSAEVWAKLPGFKTIVPVKALPGSQMLASLERSGTTFPYIVTRSAGAGRVMYFASDESWRYRYEVADKIHQRLWNQVCRWSMREPYAIESEYVALDSGDPVYAVGQSVPIRARIRDSAGEPATLPQIEAHIKKGESIVATLTLALEADLPGTYRGQANGLAPGDYDVSLVLPGFSADATNVSTMFRILEPPNSELQNVTRNDSLLTQIASLSGGKYVHENQIAELWEAMKLRHNSKLVESDQLLWQSYWWFIPVVLIIAVEWWLRKKAGLI